MGEKQVTPHQNTSFKTAQKTGDEHTNNPNTNTPPTTSQLNSNDIQEEELGPTEAEVRSMWWLNTRRRSHKHTGVKRQNFRRKKY